MQSQMIGMQSTLDRILSAVQSQTQVTQAIAHQHPGMYPPPAPSRASDRYSETGEGSSRPRFPPLPGFAPPVSRDSIAKVSYSLEQPHKYATYGIVPSTAPSSDDESEDTLPRSALNAPIEALQGLANAAAEAAAVPSNSHPRYQHYLINRLIADHQVG
jgi:hypothetical protein